mgnify:CR=1 FL=1
MKEKYILYVRDKNSDNTMKFEYGSKKELAYSASTLIENGYEEVKAVIEEIEETEIEDVIYQLESLIDDRKSFLNEDDDGEDEIFRADIEALNYAIDTIKKASPAATGKGNEKNINQCNCNTVKKVRLVSNEDLKALSKTLSRCIDDTNNVLWTLGKINESLIKNLEEDE